MRIAVVATAVSYLVQLVSRSLALPKPFAACWNERERAGARRFSHSVTHPFFSTQQHDDDSKGEHVSDGQWIGVSQSKP
jgi:hypothetical protein